jgi:hypothetical protein
MNVHQTTKESENHHYCAIILNYIYKKGTKEEKSSILSLNKYLLLIDVH